MTLRRRLTCPEALTQPGRGVSLMPQTSDRCVFVADFEHLSRPSLVSEGLTTS
jgi:hypothetical protein